MTPIIFFIITQSGSGLPRASLVNDNIRQWYPVMERALGDFFAGKGMPLYNFFNYEGVVIYDEGYYGLYNPLIWISFLLGNVINISTITTYIILCMILGSVAVALIGRQIDMDDIAIGISILAYLMVPNLYSAPRWYYVWMNYWIFPMLIFMVIKWKSGRTLINMLATSSVLLIAIMSGNSQYAMMNYMSFAVVGLLVVIYDRRQWINFFGSIFISLILGLPYLKALIYAADRSTVFKENNFLSGAIHPLKVVFFTVVPIRENILEMASKMLPSNVGLLITYFVGFSFAGGMVIGILIFLIGVLKNREFIYINIVGLACLVTLLLWVLYIGGERYVVAAILSKVPMINGFRLLEKALFVTPSVMLFPSMLGIKIIRKKREKKVYIVLVALLVLALGEQFYETAQLHLIAAPDYDYTYLNDISELNRNDFRVLFVSSDEDNHEAVSRIPYANVNVAADIQTVGGYELALGDVKNSMLALYGDVEWVGMSGSNAIKISNLIEFLETDNNLERFVAGLYENSVGYIMTYKGDLMPLMERLEQYGIVYSVIYDGGTTIYKLYGIPTIVIDADNNPIPVSQIELNQIDVEVDNPTEFVAANLRYDEHLRAYFLSENDGEKPVRLEIEQDSRGIKILTNYLMGKVVVTYENVLYRLGVWLVPMYTFMTIILFVLVGVRKTRKHE